LLLIQNISKKGNAANGMSQISAGRPANKRNIISVRKRKNGLVHRTMLVVVFNIFFLMVTLPILVFYGPFDNVKKTVVGTSMSTRRFQFVAKFFLSDASIKKLLGDSVAIDPTSSGEKMEILDFRGETKESLSVFDIESIGFKGKMLMVSNPKRVKVGYSSQLPKLGERTSAIAKNNNALAAINAGGFIDPQWTGTGGVPTGFIMHNGKIIYEGVKNIDNKTKREVVGFTDEGMLIVGLHTMNELYNYNVKEAVSFGPALVVNGKPTIKKGDGGWGIAPRTAIGQKSDGTVMFLTIDGRSISSLGATLKDIQDILIQYGAINASNLDGGSSTTMYYNQKIINTPSDSLGERTVPTVFMALPTDGGI
jgi:exopolysaccharide biosynthesis protein